MIKIMRTGAVIGNAIEPAVTADSMKFNQKVIRSWIFRYFRSLWRSDAKVGMLLIAGAASAILIANTPFYPYYRAFWELHAAVSLGWMRLDEPLHVWLNDGLMVLFFFAVGLEIKHEIIAGHLSTWRKAMLPVMAALGGMIAPALIFLLFNRGQPSIKGWGIPVATDIAFAMGLLALLGKRVPRSLKVFLISMATADDIGAVLIIAAFYTEYIDIASIALAAAILAALIISNIAGVRSTAWYAILGTALWAAFFFSGIHTTIAGVLAALTIPTAQTLNHREYLERIEEINNDLIESGEGGLEEWRLVREDRLRSLYELTDIYYHAVSPSQRLETVLRPFVYNAVLPLFAFANSAVVFQPGMASRLQEPLAIGIILGLFIGKQLGITFACAIVIRLGLARLQENLTLRAVYAVSLLGGVGFTMSLFIANLAFTGRELDMAREGVFAGSLLAGITGLIMLHLFLPKAKHQDRVP